MDRTTDEDVLSRIAKMMQMPLLDGEDVQHKGKQEESKQSEDDKRKTCQLDAGKLLAEPLSAFDMAGGR